MLQAFHKYQKSVLFILIAGAICISMLLFGLNPYGGSSSEAYALKVNDQEIDNVEFYKVKENIERSYQERLGNFYQQFLEAAGINTTQQAIDTIIQQALIRQAARQLDMYVSQQEVNQAVRNLFGDQFSEQRYAEFLRATGQKSAGFKAQIARDILPQEITKMIGTHTLITDSEIRSKIIRDETKYSYQAAIFKPEKLEKDVTLPKDEELKEYYEENAANYEEPDKASFNYIVIDPQQNLDLVDIPDEDIEVYYADRISDYTEPEQVKARAIFLTYDVAEPDKQEKVTALADELVSKINAGEDFAKLAKKYSEDEGSKDKGGDLGWVKRGQKKDLETALFSQDSMGAAKLISLPGSYYIVQVEDYKEESVKPLEEVRETIEASLKKQEAPAYALLKAQDLYDLWISGESDLQAIAKDNSYELKEQVEALSAEQDPEPKLRGLARQVIELQEDVKQLHEVGNLVVLAELKDFIPRTIPEYEKVKEKTIADYNKGQSKVLASQKADEFLDQVQAEGADFSKLIKLAKAETKEIKEEKRESRKDELASEEINKAVFAMDKPGLVDGTFEFQGNHYIFQVTSITQPSEEEIKEKFEEYEEKAYNNSVEIALSTLINQLKAKAEIEISPALSTDV